MPTSAVAAVIAFTYAILLAFWLLTMPFTRRNSSNLAAVEAPKPAPDPQTRWRFLPAAVGTLGVFLANIAAIGMVLAAAVWPELEGRLDSFRIALPLEFRLVGALLFILNGIWGLLVMVFNPAYTPFFLDRTGKILLAGKGPYAIIRHPRYASEATLNIILLFLTGTWISLIGILGWGAMRRQAAREEEFLLRAAPDVYGRYQARTGGFLPRWKFRKED
jgi:protein-S-isoprenylcysteine O-methyltransferase Ste14